MPTLASEFIRRITDQLGEESKDFLDSLDSPSITSIRLNADKSKVVPFEETSPVKWCETGYYLASRPSFTFDPLFHAGHYYVQESSSMFLEQVFEQLVDKNAELNVIDLCAAPGGKSTHLLSLLNEKSLLISNEVIQSRASILAENIIRWGKANTIICNNDPEHFQEFENCFDIVLVDAPCSGEGMFRKDINSRQEWSEGNVKLCSARQQRILSTAKNLVKPGGLLIYSTCTFSETEDEDQIQHLIETGNWKSLQLSISDFPEIKETILNNQYGYRFYPHKVKGEGFFISVLKKERIEAEGNWPRVSKKINFVDKNSLQAIKHFVSVDENDFILHQNQILLFPKILKNEMLGFLNSRMHIKKFGTEIGQVIREELIPAQSLAMSNHCLDTITSFELTYEQAISYLQKNDFQVNSAAKGWHIMKYKGANLGWAKLLGNRLNNTYPKEWRIRKQNEN